MHHHPHPLLRFAVPLAIVGLAPLVVASCSDDEESPSTSTSTASSAPMVETTTTTETPSGSVDAAEVATALCEAYDGVQEPGAVDELLALMSDDVVVTDTVLGASLTGKEQVRGYLTSEAFAPFDTMTCGVTVSRGGWVAGSYTLGNSTTGGGGQGIAAIHVTDGLVDQQVNYYTPVESGVTAPPTETVTDSVVLDYCHAWDDGADADAVVSFMAPDAVLQIVGPIEGTDAIRAFIENDFDFDQNDCGSEAVVNGAWVGAAAGFTNSTTGATAGGVNVVHVDDAGQVIGHYVHYEAEG